MAETDDKGKKEIIPPLPRLKSLVVSEIRDFTGKHPVDFNVFYRVFALTASLLLIVYATSSSIATHRDELTAIREGRSAIRTKLGLNKSSLEKHTAGMPAPQTGSEPVVANERQKTAIGNNDTFSKDPLGPAPIDALEEPTASGAAPRIADDGRKPWYAYSRPYDRSDPRPRIAIIFGELGLARLISEAAIKDMPGPVTLAFSAQSPAADAWMLRARSLGHETVLSVPMEPLDYPSSDPGPETLLIKNSLQQNIRLLVKHMQSGKGYIGLMSFSGSRMSSTPDKLRSILTEVDSRGLMWLDARLTPLSSAYSLAKDIGLPASIADFHIPADAGSAAVETIIGDAETHARQTGKSIVLVEASPLTLQRVKEWASALPQKNFSLAPLTAVTE